MSSRYNDRQKAYNTNEGYKQIFEDRGVSRIEQYRTGALLYPTSDQIRSLTLLTHVWTYGDRYYKLAYEAYGRASLWWVIAHFNKRPTESHVQYGDIIYIPQPLEKVLMYYGV